MFVLGTSMMIGTFIGAGIYEAFVGSSSVPTSFLVIEFFSGLALYFVGIWFYVLSKVGKKATHSCGICREEFKGRMLRLWKNEHYKTKHPEYTQWFKRWVRNFYLISGPYLSIMVISVFLWLKYGDP